MEEDDCCLVMDVDPAEEKEEVNIINIHGLVESIIKQCSKWKKIDEGVKNLLKSRNLNNNNALKSFKKDNFSTPEEKNKFKYTVIADLLQEHKEKLSNCDLLFLASIQVDLNELNNRILNCENINETKCTDTVLIFTLRYGNIYAKDFLECVKILVKAGVDVKKYDKFGMTAIDYVAQLYEKKKYVSNIRNVFEQIARVIVDKGMYQNENKKTMAFLKEIHITIDSYEEMEEKTKLFYYIITNDVKNLQQFDNIELYVNSDTDENTLLQLACVRKCSPEIVSYLLKKGADPNKTTSCNSRTPLELAAKDRRRQKLFEIILSHKKTEVNQDQYNKFLRWRSKSMHPKMFELFLESDKVKPYFKSDTGNNPLYYAVIFSHKEAIQKLLKKGASLTEKNKVNKCVLDVINPADLEKYFDTCLALDNYQSDFSHPEYKMVLRFKSLCNVDDENINKKECDEDNENKNKQECKVDKNKNKKESAVISKLGNRTHLEHLLIHPLIHVFISLKWHRTKPYFWIIFGIQLVLYLILSCLFYQFSNLSTGWTIFTGICVLFNIALKAPVFLFYWYKNKFRKFNVIMERIPLHFFVEIFLIIIFIGSFIQAQIRAFVFITMIISLLLSIGYHPKLSKWSIMLQKIFKTFIILFFFFSCIIVAFSAGFHILFQTEPKFKNFLAALFHTYVMTTGEFNIDDDFDFGGAGGYLIFLLFIMSICLVIVNFWIGVAVTDIERIEKRSKVNALHNVIIFISFIEYEYVYSLSSFSTPLLTFFNIRNPFLCFQNENEFDIDFYVNKENQFDKSKKTQENYFPRRVDVECLDKIKKHYFKMKIKPTEHEGILKTLNQHSEILHKILQKANLDKTQK